MFVVLFKLSSVAKEQELAAEVLRSLGIDADIYLPVARERGFVAMVKQILDTQVWDFTDHQGLRRACDAATGAYAEWGRINARLYPALSTSLLDIAFCFMMLPFTNYLKQDGRHGAWVLAIAVGLGVACIALYARLILTLVRRPPGVR